MICPSVHIIEDFFLESKRGLAKDYNDFFKSNGIKFRNELKNTKANYWLMCIELDNKKERDLFIKETNKLKIMTRPIWNLMHRLPMYSSCQKDSQKNSIFLNNNRIGDLTNCVWSYRLKKSIGFALVSCKAKVGDRVSINLDGTIAGGILVDLPFC